MTGQGLPGIEVLFREHTRLSKKLSGEELRAVRRYIEQRLEHEHQGLTFKLRHIKAAQDLNEREYDRSLQSLQKELDKEKWIAHEFQREFISLTEVLQQRDTRFRLKSETLIDDLKKARRALASTENSKTLEDSEREKFGSIIAEQEQKLNQLRINHRKRYEALEAKCTGEKGKQQKEILKLKYQLSQRDLEIGRLRGERFERKQEKTVTFKDTYCDSSSCRAWVDLEQCRTQLVQKCKDITTLNFQLEQCRQKIREQARLLELIPPRLGMVKDSMSNHKVKTMAAYSLGRTRLCKR